MIITVFRSRLNPDATEDYGAMAVEMTELARTMDGFVSVKTFIAEDGERCTIVEFETQEQHDAWGNHPRHNAAQARGRQHFYTAYDLKVAEVTRHSALNRSANQVGDQADDVGGQSPSP